LINTDATLAKPFYTELFGWDRYNKEMPDRVKPVEDDVVSIMLMQSGIEGTPAMWGTYVTVDDVDTRVVKAEILGANIMVSPQNLHDVGRFAVICDPQGKMLTMITYSS